MSEEFEEQAPQQFDLNRYLGVIRRRHLPFLVLLFSAWVIVWGASWFLPARYKSSTLILVEQPTLPRNYVVPNVSDDLQDRLQSITQQILSRTRLLLIIDKHHLYQDKHHVPSPDEKVEQMRKDVDIELVRDPQNAAITAFRVSYSAPDPRVAQEVTSELTNLFIDENLKVREQESEDTTEFIERQLAGARANLADQEAKVRAFEAAHEGELPSQEGSNLQILSGLQAQLQNEEDALNAAKQQHVYFQSLIEQYRTLQATTRGPGGTPTGLAAMDQQIETLRNRLSELSSRYTDRYPEVQSLKAELVRTEKMRSDLIAGLKKNADSRDQSAAGVGDAQDPAQDSPLLQLQSQIRANQIEISDKEQAIANLKKRINDYQGRLSAEPAREQELADLTRGYDQSKANYDDLLKKESDSRMATSMEQMQEGERFTMLDPPSLPLKPDFPNRLKLCGIGAGVGAALGLLLVIVLELVDDRMYSEQEIKKLLPVAVVSEIPEIATPADLQARKRTMVLGWSIAAFVVIAILAGSAFSYLHA